MLAIKNVCGIVLLHYIFLTLFMNEDHFEKTKEAVLTHVSALFEEIEQETALSHQEKYALLEDIMASASDVDELRVAFEQWFSEHSDDIGFEHDSDEIWDQALGNEIEDDDEEYEESEDDEDDKSVVADADEDEDEDEEWA